MSDPADPGPEGPAIIESVRRLNRLFRLYEHVERLAQATRIGATDEARLVTVLRQLTFDFWRELMGPAFDAPAHRRAVLFWIERNLQRLHRSAVLPAAALDQAEQRIERELAALGPGDEGDLWPPDPERQPVRTALTRLYLLQSLNIRIEELLRIGMIPGSLREHLRLDLVERGDALFEHVLGEKREGPDEALAFLPAELAGYHARGLLTDAALAHLERIVELARGMPATVGNDDGTSELVVAGGPGDGVAGPESASATAPAYDAASPRPAPADERGGAPDLPPAVVGAVSGGQAPIDGRAATGSAAPGPGAAPTGSGAAHTGDGVALLVEAAAMLELERRLRHSPSVPRRELERWTAAVEAESSRVRLAVGAEELERAVGSLAARIGLEWPGSGEAPGPDLVFVEGTEEAGFETDWARDIASRLAAGPPPPRSQGAPDASRGSSGRGPARCAAGAAPVRPALPQEAEMRSRAHPGASGGAARPTPGQPAAAPGAAMPPRSPRGTAATAPGRPEEGPRQPRHGWELLLASILEEVGINWLLFSGVFLVLGAGVLLAVKHWSSLLPWMQYLLLVGTVSSFFGLSLATRVVMRLERTPLALFSVVLLFTPLNVVAIDALGLLAGTGPLGPEWATAISGTFGVLLMGIVGSVQVLQVEAFRFAPGLTACSLLYLFAAMLSRRAPDLWMQAGAVATAVLLARAQLRYSLISLQERGFLPVGLAALALAVSATGLRLGASAAGIGLTVIGAGHLLLEAGFALAGMTLGPLQKDPGPLPARLVRTGALLAAAGASFVLFPRPIGNPAGILALAYASRALYLAFARLRGGLEFMLFLPTPAILLLLLPHADPRLAALWQGPLLRGRPGDMIHDAVLCLPGVLVGPCYAWLALRLQRRGHETYRGILNLIAATSGTLALLLTLPSRPAGLVAALFSLGAWAGLAGYLKFRYMVTLSTFSATLVVVQLARMLALPPWAWLFVLVGTANLILAARLLGRLPDTSAFDALLVPGDPFIPVSNLQAVLAIVLYLCGLAAGDVSGPSGWPYDLTLAAAAAYFAGSLLVEYRTGAALAPTLLALLEAWVIAERAVGLEHLELGWLLIGSATLALVVGHALGAPALVRWLSARGPVSLRAPWIPERLRRAHWRVAGALSALALISPPTAGGDGSLKYLAVAGIQLGLARTFASAGAVGVCAAVLALQSPFVYTIHQPWLCLGMQALNLLLAAGAFFLATRARHRGERPITFAVAGYCLLAVAAVFFIAPLLTTELSRMADGAPAALPASLLAAAAGVAAIVAAGPLAAEPLVYCGELALALAYGRLLLTGYVQTTLATGFLMVGASFLLILLHERLTDPGWLVYQRPARHTALVLPLIALLKALAVGGPAGALLTFMVGLVFHMIRMRGGSPECLYFALLLYNVASAMIPWAPEGMPALRYLAPMGLSVLAFAHSPGNGLDRGQAQTWRLVGVLLICGDPLPRALLGTQDDLAFLLLLLLALALGATGVLLRVRVYLVTGSALLVTSVTVFVAKQIFRETHLGLVSMLAIGVLLILAGAVFEQARARLREALDRLSARFSDWS